MNDDIQQAIFYTLYLNAYKLGQEDIREMAAKYIEPTEDHRNCPSDNRYEYEGVEMLSDYAFAIRNFPTEGEVK